MSSPQSPSQKFDLTITVSLVAVLKSFKVVRGNKAQKRCTKNILCILTFHTMNTSSDVDDSERSVSC